MNSNKFFNRVGALALVCMIAISSAAFAGGGHGRKGGAFDAEQMLKRLSAKLNLTQDQQTRIKALVDQFKSANASTIAEMKSLHEQMKSLKQGGADRNSEQMQALHQQMKAKRESLQAARQQLMTQIKGVLTPEQVAQLEQMKENRGDKGARGKGKAKGRGQSQGQGSTGGSTIR